MQLIPIEMTVRIYIHNSSLGAVVKVLASGASHLGGAGSKLRRVHFLLLSCFDLPTKCGSFCSVNSKTGPSFPRFHQECGTTCIWVYAKYLGAKVFRTKISSSLIEKREVLAGVK